MTKKTILLISFIITLSISIIPIQRNTRIGFECTTENQQLCFKKLPSHGFPIIIADTTPFESPTYTIDYTGLETYIGALLPFAANWLIYYMFILLISKIKNKKT